MDDEDSVEDEPCPNCGAVIIPGCRCDECGWPDQMDDEQEDMQVW